MEELIYILVRQVCKLKLKLKLFIVEMNNNAILTQELLNLFNLDRCTFKIIFFVSKLKQLL